jgi:hypothetical protein
MSARSSLRARTFYARVERAVLGVVMGIAAFVIERRVLRAIRRSGAAEPPPDAATVERAAGDGAVSVRLPGDGRRSGEP